MFRKTYKVVVLAIVGNRLNVVEKQAVRKTTEGSYLYILKNVKLNQSYIL